MKLIEGLAHISPVPMTIINGWAKGRQFRWCNGHIQTRVNEKKTWHRLINISVALLEYAEIDDTELL